MTVGPDTLSIPVSCAVVTILLTRSLLFHVPVEQYTNLTEERLAEVQRCIARYILGWESRVVFSRPAQTLIGRAILRFSKLERVALMRLAEALRNGVTRFTAGAGACSRPYFNVLTLD